MRDVSLQSLRGTIGVIPQETLLFNDTLGYNIRYGDLNVSQDRLDEVVERSKLAGVVHQLPKGMDSIVGERGMKLSGGEKQRGEFGITGLVDDNVVVTHCMAICCLDFQCQLRGQCSRMHPSCCAMSPLLPWIPPQSMMLCIS